MSIIDFLDNYVFGPLNLIDRAEGAVRLAARHDSGVRFGVKRLDRGGQHSRPDVRRMLKRYGVDTFGITHDATNLYFLVGQRQASWAAYLLKNAGVEYSGGVSSKTRSRGRMPVAWKDKR